MRGGGEDKTGAKGGNGGTRERNGRGLKDGNEKKWKGGARVRNVGSNLGQK